MTKKEIIYTDHYALIIGDEKPVEGDCVFCIENRSFIIERITSGQLRFLDNDIFKKVIGHKPLGDAPVLEWVPLLPDWDEQNVADKLANDYANQFIGTDDCVADVDFKAGYIKAKETYKYTEDDMITAMYKACEMSKQIGSRFMIDLKDISEYLKSLQHSRLPKYFEYETNYRVRSGTIQEHKDGLAGFEYYEPRTIKNTKDQVEIVGNFEF